MENYQMKTDSKTVVFAKINQYNYLKTYLKGQKTYPIGYKTMQKQHFYTRSGTI